MRREEEKYTRLDELARALGEEKVPEISEEKSSELVARALEHHDRQLLKKHSFYRIKTKKSFNVARVALAAIVLLSCLSASLLFYVFQNAQEPVAIDTTQFSLPSGDKLALSSGARFNIDSLGMNRSIAVKKGDVLFDVKALQDHESFVVQTPHLRAEVKGTVFSVQVSKTQSIVNVFEGKVQVFHHGKRLALMQDEFYDSRGDKGTVAKQVPLAEIARKAVLRRTRAQERASLRKKKLEDTTSSVEPETQEQAKQSEQIVTKLPKATRLSHALRRAKQLLLDGRYEELLVMAQDATDSGLESAAWLILQGDAYRGLSRFHEAIKSYEKACEQDGLSLSERQQFGYLAARLYFWKLSQYDEALRVLDLTGADAPASAVEERALALRVRVLWKAHRIEEAHRFAQIYMLRFPKGGSRAWLEGLL
ncbi:MAG: FecR domain-containing protein [Myxococcales bacterium]|nr:MAG: FecR domain-containing protein [Myxococcales bacterium]